MSAFGFNQTYAYNPATEKVVPKDAVVLDLDEVIRSVAFDDGHPSVARVLNKLRGTRSTILHSLADQIEAQTKPPRIPEPGWGAVVEAHTLINETRRRWVNAGGGSTQWHDDGRGTAIWDVLIDPVLIREGVES